MNDKITNIELKFVCNQNWDQMDLSRQGKYCSQCSKTIYDFTDQKPAYFMQILQENNQSVCGRFKADQLKPQPIAIPWWKKRLSAAFLFLGLISLSGCLQAQTKADENTKTPPKDLEELESFKMGEVVIAAPTKKPEQYKALIQFIDKNYKIPAKTPDGYIKAQFQVQENGKLTGLKVVKSLSTAADAELLKVIKSAPSWGKFWAKKLEYPSVYQVMIAISGGKVRIMELN